MKTYVKAFVGLTVFLSMAGTSAIAQNGKFGKTPQDSLECRKQISFLNFGTKSGELDELTIPLNKAIALCPQATSNLYVWGVTIWENKVNKAKSPEEKAKYVDSLMQCYDYRLQYYPDKFTAEDVAYRKAVALANFTPDKHEAILKEMVKYLDITKEKADASMVPQAFQQIKLMYEDKLKTTDEVIEAYDKSMALLNKMPDNEVVQKAKADVEGLFITIPELSSCENLIAIYEPKYKADPTNLELLRKIVYTLESRQCHESQLFSDAAEALYKLDPSEKAVSALVKLFAYKKDYEKAAEYLKKAIAMHTEPIEKSKLETQLAMLYLTEMNSSSQALSHARAAASLDPNNGHALMLVATCYAKSAAGGRACGEFESKAVFWAVVDAYARAKNADPSLTDEINKAINQYSQYFPSKEDIFMNGMKEGDSYSVSCNGINERTTIRGRR